MKSILIVAAHSDDEALGCGGAIARHKAEGDTVSAVFMADGVSSRIDVCQDELKKRLAAAKQAHDLLGLDEVHYLSLPDNAMDSVSMLEVVQKLEPIIQKYSPEIIYTHHLGDLNVDHVTTHQAVMTACRPQPGHSVKEILCFEVLSSTEWSTGTNHPFIPNVYADISDFLDTKLDALKAYEIEMRPSPHSRSVKHAEYLARHRGHSVGVEAAEAFMLIRSIR
jgi:N-acetylglucosamine malate deacetylase 1